jgi:hypothetical protein
MAPNHSLPMPARSTPRRRPESKRGFSASPQKLDSELLLSMNDGADVARAWRGSGGAVSLAKHATHAKNDSGMVRSPRPQGRRVPRFPGRLCVLGVLGVRPGPPGSLCGLRASVVSPGPSGPQQCTDSHLNERRPRRKGSARAPPRSGFSGFLPPFLPYRRARRPARAAAWRQSRRHLHPATHRRAATLPAGRLPRIERADG